MLANLTIFIYELWSQSLHFANTQNLAAMIVACERLKNYCSVDQAYWGIQWVQANQGPSQEDGGGAFIFTEVLMEFKPQFETLRKNFLLGLI